PSLLSPKGEDIRVRLVNSNNAEPMEGIPIRIYLGRDRENGFKEQWTDADGTTVFHLPPPVEEWITPAVASYLVWPSCSPYEKCDFATSEVVQHGVVALNVCAPKGKLKRQIVPHPGEVVI